MLRDLAGHLKLPYEHQYELCVSLEQACSESTVLSYFNKSQDETYTLEVDSLEQKLINFHGCCYTDG